MKIYHQAGHQTLWNINSYEEDNVGDGIIFSPVHFNYSNIVDRNKVSEKIKKKSLFDPQFYVPNSQKTKLNTYDFFPEKLMLGFETDEFGSYATDVAKMCLDFQIDNDFESIIIPTRFYNEMITDFIAKQKVFTVEPFLNVLSKLSIDKKILLTLPLTIAMIKDVEYRTQLLDWVSSYPEIDGVYLLVDFSENSKQIKDFDKLYNYCQFINELKIAELQVYCGYCNTEGLILTLLDVDAVTIGAYENTRRFSIDKFLELDVDRRGPATRLYIPKLLNWIRYDTVKEIYEDYPQIWNEIYSETDYANKMLKNISQPHFTQPESYKHHLVLIAQQYRELMSLTKDKRYDYLKDILKKAQDYYRNIYNAGVLFTDDNCREDHLSIWNRLINKIHENL